MGRGQLVIKQVLHPVLVVDDSEQYIRECKS